MTSFFSKRFLVTILALVSIYTVVAWAVNFHSEQKTNIELNVARLKGFVEVAENARKAGDFDEVVRFFPDEIRVTVIDEEGRVTFDTDSAGVGTFENHRLRQELKEAHFRSEGTGARVSVTTGHDTFYYAEYFGDHYIRVGVPNFLTAAHSFRLTRLLLLLGIVILFFLAWRMVIAIREHREHLESLARLSKQIATGEEINPDEYPAGTGDEITRELLEIVRQRELATKELAQSRERLLLHFEAANIGIGLFDRSRNTVFTNSLFIQYASMISSTPITEVSQFIDDPLLSDLRDFAGRPYDPEDRIHRIKIDRNGHYYEIQCLKGEKGGFELTISDITEAERNRLLKQELTSNITHELRTPLTAIRGYLEMLSYHGLSEDERVTFTDKALGQSTRLSSLLDDVSLLAKLDEPTNNYTFEEVDLKLLVEEVRVAFVDRLSDAKDTFHNNLPDNLAIRGNRSLLFSIFQNLLENAIRYAGDGVTIELNLYHRDNRYLYFSFYDTGKGVDDSHLGRLFERFYRVDEGRSRAKGGTGLGLSIVRNAISFHGGQAQARRHHSGGLEILFTIQIKANRKAPK